jgi:tetrapyrrole methylase family protein/MazG family protein
MESKGMDEQRKKRIADGLLHLLEIMARLRGPDGCPWDREQDHQTLKKYLIEEAHEACEAIDHNVPDKVADELGDVLLQVVFHAQIGLENGTFDMADVLDHINTKLVVRHPHVFGDVKVDSSKEVLQNWEANKAKERGSHASLLDGIPKALPALLRARRIQERAAQVGFDWNNIGEVLDKMEEEVREFREACDRHATDRIEDELGDFLFAVVNVARYLDTDPEAALHRTVRKFIRRFRYIEDKLRENGRTFEESSLKEMDAYWDEAKRTEKDA